MPFSRTDRRDLLRGVAFLTPNILGFLAFTLVPLTLSLALAFTNWDLRLHNMFKDAPLKFVGLENFRRLLSEVDFWQYLGNTLFLMMVLPLGVAGSLFLAILLSKDLRGGSRSVWGWLIAGALLICGVGGLLMAGAGATSMTILIGGLLGTILLTGTLGRSSVYRTLYYLPSFTAGVAIYILWKKLYGPHTGPINNALRPVVDRLTSAVNAIPAGWLQGATWACTGLMVLLLLFGARRMLVLWIDGEAGWLSAALGAVLLVLPAALAPRWSAQAGAGWSIAVAAAVVIVAGLVWAAFRRRDFTCAADEGIGHALMLCGILMVGQFVLTGVGNVLYHLPAMASGAEGMEPPKWLSTYHWAKPSFMIIGFWAAVGSQNMILYLAGISNIPPELNEAADIDGASPVQRFWNVTWPQLAPVTFFIVIMSMIYGLQGGFEVARTLTEGGPDGSTTTLSYFIYIEGFQTGRLGYASAIAWTLFALVFTATIFNWRFGNRYVND